MNNVGTIPSRYSIGWDVGGWNCDKNANSRDAIVILNDALGIIGTPWRGNLREAINKASSGREWIGNLFEVCESTAPDEPIQVVMAIDTPLGFSEAFRRLVNDLEGAEAIGSSHQNPYLFRQSEQYLFNRGWKPLSPVKDMIGSQATKGIHVLGKFAPQIESCGVWHNGAGFRAIESYPTVCRESSIIRQLREQLDPMGHQDIEDALVCALLAHLFTTNRELVLGPGPDIPEKEGWIWTPKE